MTKEPGDSRDPIRDFAQLDRVGALITPILTYEWKEKFIDAVLQAGSIDAMPEPFKAWCLNPGQIPNEYLELMDKER